jgi:transposase
MAEAIFDYLLNRQGSYLDETVDYIRDVFGVDVSTDSLRRILKKNKWS